MPADQELNPNTVYDIRFFLEDQGDTDLDPQEGTVEVAMVLGQSSRVEAPVFTPSGGGFSGNVKVQLACATPGAAIHYTLDGTQLSKTTEVKAIAMKEGMQESPVVSAVFTRQSGSSSGGSGGGSSGGKGENKVISGESIVSKADLTTFNPEVTTQEGLARVTITSIMGEQLLAEAEQDQSSQLVIQPHITGEPGRVLVALPQSFIQELVDQTAMGLTVDNLLGKVFIPYHGLREISQQTGDTVTIDLEKHPSVILPSTCRLTVMAYHPCPGGLWLRCPEVRIAGGW